MAEGPTGWQRWLWLACYLTAGAVAAAVPGVLVLTVLMGVPQQIAVAGAVLAVTAAFGLGVLFGRLLLRSEPVPRPSSAAAVGILVATLCHLAMPLPLLLFAGGDGLAAWLILAVASLVVAGPVTLPIGAVAGAIAARRWQPADRPTLRRRAAGWLSRCGWCGRARTAPRAATP